MWPCAYVTPTMNRPQWHEPLYMNFARQTIPNRRLYVLDESAQPSKFFTKLRDPRVTYVHSPGAPRIEGVTNIGRARNRLNAMTNEMFVLHADDDDELHPLYGETMVSRLGGAALAKLGVWRALQGDRVFEWDVTKMGGKHFAIQGKERHVVDVPPGGEMMIQDGLSIGYGFSFVYPRATWEAIKFPEEGTEDIPWARAIRAAGGKIVQVMDCAHLCLHTMHGSNSAAYPQKFVGRQHMIGSMNPSMSELPRGQDIQVQPGVTYEILCSVKNAHSLRELTVRAASYGVNIQGAQDNTSPATFGVDAAPNGYRLVWIQATSTRGGTLPWKVPAPLSMFDKTSVVRAWSSQPSRMVGACPVKPVFPAR